MFLTGATVGFWQASQTSETICIKNHFSTFIHLQKSHWPLLRSFIKPLSPLNAPHFHQNGDKVIKSILEKKGNENGCTAPALFYREPLKKSSPSIWKDLKEAQLHKQSSQVFRGFWNINKRACRYIILQQQLWEQRENVFESHYKSHNTATALHIQAWLVPKATWQRNPVFTDGSCRGSVRVHVCVSV